jgi:hypothetical protein
MMRATSVLVGIAILGMIGCGGGSPTEPSGGGSTGSGSGSSSGSGGTFNVRITDSPFGGAKAVLIVFSEAAARDSGGTWRKIAFNGGTATRTCDLKKLTNGNQDLLATGSMSPGSYTHIRLTVQSAKIFFDYGSTSPTPCAATIAEPAGAVFPLRLSPATGEVNGGYSITADATLNVLLDFDADTSIKDQGGNVYDLIPTLRLMSVS